MINYTVFLFSFSSLPSLLSSLPHYVGALAAKLLFTSGKPYNSNKSRKSYYAA
jgi:hypothetical protein